MQIAVLISIAIFYIYALIKYSRSISSFIFLIPMINALTDMTIGYSNERIFAIFSIIRAVILYTVIFYIIRKNAKFKDPLVISILLAVSYYFIKVIFSSNILLSLNSCLRMIVSLFMILAGYHIINKYRDLIKINKIYLWSLFVLILNFAIAQVFKIGINPYDELETQFYLGGGGVQLITSLPFIIFTFPFAFQFVKSPIQKYIYLFLSLLAVIIVLIAMKRIVVASLAVGFGVFLFFSVVSKKTLFSFIIVFTILYATLPLYEGIISSRGKRLEETNLQEEKQAKDFAWWLTDVRKNPKIIVFGREFLNSRDTIGGGLRGLHVDYIILLHGSGIVGLLLYFNILYQIIRRYLRLNRFYRSHLYYNVSKISFWALILCILTISFSGGIVGITARSYAFLYLGVIIACFEKMFPRMQYEITQIQKVEEKQ